jgi:hypothetical protein
MRNALLLAFLMVFTLQGFAQEKAKVTDFRNIEWSTHKDSVFRSGEKVNFVKVENGVEDNAYRIPNDDMTIGTVKFDKLHYIFNDNNRFKKVFMQADQGYLADMEFILNYKFGKPSKVQNLGYVNIKNWNLENATFTLSEFKNNRDIFTLSLESQWERSANFEENINVEDF